MVSFRLRSGVYRRRRQANRLQLETLEARLPLELENPLVSLWKLERPGPRLSLYELP